MQKGYKRKAKGMALLQCIIGLIVLVIVVLLLYFILTMDYSDRLKEGAQLRSYVPQATATPVPVPVAAPVEHETPEPSAEPDVQETVPAQEETAAVPVNTNASDYLDEPIDVERTAASNETPSPTAVPTEIPGTPEPTDEPVATPGPDPTKVPTGLYASMQQIKQSVPKPTSKNIELGITKCVRSVADNSSVLYLAGYAYINESKIDAASVEYRLVIVSSNGAALMAEVNRVDGISGVDHGDTKCSNPSGADFEVYLNVENFPDDVYYLGILFNKNGKFVLSQFPNKLSFSVVNHRVLTDVPTVSGN